MDHQPQDRRYDQPLIARQQKLPTTKAPRIQPQRLKRSISTATIDIVIDILLLVISTAFLGLAIEARLYDGADAVQYQDILSLLVKGTELGPTILPIVFATIIGRASKAILSWQLEKGTTIGTLDLLASSTSLSSIVLAQFTLRIFTLFSPVLVLVWILSPVGSQASLRLISTYPSNTSIPWNFSYMQQNFPFADNYTHPEALGPLTGINGIYLSGLLSPATTKTSPRDLWGNVKTPMIEELESYETPDVEGWFNVPSSNVTYSSLVGIPIANIPDNTTYASLDLGTSYWVLNCSEIEFNSSTWTDWIRGFTFRSPQDPVRHIAWNPDSKSTTSSSCQIRTTYVQLHVECLNNGAVSFCEPTRMRYSQLKTNPVANYTYLDSAWSSLAYWFTTNGQSSIQDVYLVQPLNPLNFSTSVDAYNISVNDYETRLAQLLNTYWIASVGQSAIVEGLSNIDEYLTISTTSTIGSAITENEKIHCSKTWMALLITASMIMIIGIILRACLTLFFCRAPDYLNGNISSLLRDNPYVYPRASMNYNSAHQATHLAQSVKHLRVRLGDVFETGIVGHLAIGSLNGKNNVAPITKYRTFD